MNYSMILYIGMVLPVASLFTVTKAKAQTADPCAGLTCSNHGTCVVKAGVPVGPITAIVQLTLWASIPIYLSMCVLLFRVYVVLSTNIVLVLGRTHS